MTDLRLSLNLDRRLWLPNVQRWLDATWIDEIIETIVAAKDVYPNIFMITLNTPKTYNHLGDTGVFIIRPLSRSEYSTVVKFDELGIAYNRDLVVGKGILWPGPELRDTLLAGLVESAYDIVEEVSAWGNINTIREIQAEKRVSLGVGSENVNIMSHLDMMVSTIFKAIDPFSLPHLDAYQSMELISMVEKVLEEQEFKFDMTPPGEREHVLEQRRKKFNMRRNQNDGPQR